MARKVFQDFANTLPRMLVGWRMFDDLEALAKLPDGTLTIDVLAGRASHTGTTQISLKVAGAMHAWLQSSLAERGIAPDALDRVLVVARIRTDRIPTDRKHIVSFDFQCESSLTSGSRTYRGSLADKHVWHSRVGT
jgi:hypothetical protein